MGVDEAPLTYTALADDNASVTTTKIDFVFSAAITDLTAGDIAIGGTPGAADMGTLTGSGANWSLSITVTAMGAATVSINMAGIESGGKTITLYKIPNPASSDLSIKFGITSTGTVTVGEVTATFNAVHAYLATNPAVTETTSIGAGTMPAGLAKNIGTIALGDYIDLVSLSITAYPAGQGGLSNLTNRTLLRLIVVGINSFNEGQGDTYTGNGNGTTPHLVFQFQNIPVKHRMNPDNDNTGGYKSSEMRKYLVDIGGSGGNFLTGLINAGVPPSVIWAPKRYAANRGYGATAADELQDKLWLPTQWELFDNYSGGSSSPYENAANQARLAYYANNTSRIKSDGSAAATFWEASPHSNYTISFCAINGSGNVSMNISASVVSGCAPAFCVK